MTPRTEVSDAPSGQTPGFHDRMLLRSASSREPDAAVAVRELARQLGDEADLYLAFVPAGYDLDAMAAALTGWAGDRLIACTSAGAIGSQGYTRADLLAVAVSGPPVAAQQGVIMTLVAASERRAESAARLGTQHVVEQRTARLHQAERVLRSVIEALDGALCIVGADSTVLDANRRWLQLLPPAEPAAGGPVAGAVGSDFFAWCRTTDGMQDLLAEAADLVREVLETCDPTDATDPAEPADRSVKGQVELDGALRWVVVRIHPVRDHPAARAVVSMIDITDGLRTQEQLRLATADAEAVGRRRDLIAGPCLESAEFSSFLDRLDRGQGADGEFQLLSRQGELYWADIEVRPVQDGDHVAHLV
jgi:PAS domain-containing protein